MPKAFLQILYDTAGSTGYDDQMALNAVREELKPEWAHVCDPTLLEREAELAAKLRRTCEWMRLLREAMWERRTGFGRVVAEDVLGDLG